MKSGIVLSTTADSTCDRTYGLRGRWQSERALDAGYQKPISKPAEPEELAPAIATLVGRCIAWPANIIRVGMEIIFLLVGLLFIAVGAIITLFEVRARHGTTPLLARVIGFSTGRSNTPNSPSFHSVAHYVGPNGRDYYLERAVGSSAPLYAVGDSVTVLVNPAQPEKAVLKSALSFFIGIALALMGLAFVIVFWLAFQAGVYSIAMAALVLGAFVLGKWWISGKAIRPMLRQHTFAAAAMLLDSERRCVELFFGQDSTGLELTRRFSGPVPRPTSPGTSERSYLPVRPFFPASPSLARRRRKE